MRKEWKSEYTKITQDDWILGIDLGIASCGWALICDPDKGGGIIAMGVRMFDAPETDKERTPTNQLRRGHRGLRRVLRRRRQRMRDIRKLFVQNRLIESDSKSALKISGLDPWQLRAEALDRKLKPEELAVALAHIAKHRGFKSNSKRDGGANAPDETSKMKKQIEVNRIKQATFRTVGEMFAKDPQFARRKRNRDGNFDRSVLRDDQFREVRIIFDNQRRAGNALATPEFEAQFLSIAERQKPLQDSEDRVGVCNFEQGERRAAKRSHSFELFRFLSRLTSLRIKQGKNERALTPSEIEKATKDFGQQNGMTFKRLRDLLDLEDEAFVGIPADEEKKRDVVNRSSSNGCMQGTNALRKCLGDSLFQELQGRGELLDKIAFVISFREELSSIERGLSELDLNTDAISQLMKGASEGDFSAFKQAGHISARACRAIIPHLRAGMVYSEACKAAGYDHAKQADTDLDQIANPIARKALTEALKQVKAIVDVHGMPGRMHIELARDVGKSLEEREEIRKGIEKRNKERDRLRFEFKEMVGQEAANAEDLMRFELWREQCGRCMYTDEAIPVGKIVSSDRTLEVDHILPWSRSGDDSFINKTLCFASANQQKKGQTPFEWFGKDEARWDAFAARVESNKSMKGRKKRNYLLKDATILETKFRERNINDTRYATRVLLNMLARKYENDKRVHVYSRPGPLTDRLRRGWGLQGMKKNAQGERISDDRHHALDALICAATTQSQLQKLTKAFQECERRGLHRDFSNLDPPWPTFVADVKAKMTEVFVSRAERQRARGEGHAATIRAIGERDGEKVVYERKAIWDLKASDLARVKDPERNKHIVAALQEWIDAKKPKDAVPLSPKGDAISKVTLVTNKKVDVEVRDGAADRGEMVRVDVFAKPNKKGKREYYLVPIYRHQIADAKDWPTPPNQAVQAYVSENDWPAMGAQFEFLWSIFSMSFIELQQKDGTIIYGYFRGLDRATGAVGLSPHYSKDGLIKGIGARTLTSFRKFQVDRLGLRFEIEKEKRTWHGKVCT